jgi:RNA polymerase sigma-70 factor (ECF subfamily)
LDPIATKKKTRFEKLYAEDDLVLMTQIAQGSADAFQTVLDLHMLPIYHFSYSILQDISAAEDITQETCVKLWNHAKNWSPEGRVRSWLFRIAHNLCIDEIRRRKPHADIDTFADSIADHSDDPAQKITESQISKTVKDALFQLPVRQRSALMLVHYSDCSNKEAAEAMGVSVDALESLLSRGRKSLKERLSNHKDKLWEG